MELEDLKKNWNIMEDRLGKLEMEQRHLQTKTVETKVQQVRRRLLGRTSMLIVCLPILLWVIVRHQAYNFSVLTWVLMFLFVVLIIARQVMWWWLLKKIDCLTMTVREVCLVESRFHMAFKAGVAVGVVWAIPLLASMIWDMSRFGDRYMLIGVWTGLAVGLVVGTHKFLRAWRGVKELRKAISDLQ